ncbi:hypothetical protein F2P81_008540 [Scophthalmus maximus]|uniref:Uncharacterized protein n=1 Tax=Scophthalmus maximus TaxID=52904 RepID=A0A6A4T599_SCOMX|nr:hypothetical protein F2P81_008540 [Scophthalmus maximus]
MLITITVGGVGNYGGGGGEEKVVFLRRRKLYNCRQPVPPRRNDIITACLGKRHRIDVFTLRCQSPGVSVTGAEEGGRRQSVHTGMDGTRQHRFLFPVSNI